MQKDTIPGWAALGIIAFLIVFGVVFGYLITWDAETDAVTLRHPQRGHVIQCGPYKYIGGFGGSRGVRSDRNRAEGMLRRCVEHNLKGGYERVTG
jgi:hypothetical protein